MGRIHAFILRISIWPVWLFFLLCELAFAGYLMPKSAADMKTSCGEQVRIPDIEIGYTAEQLRNMLSFMNDSCRDLYYNITTITDSFYPLAYGFFFFFSIVMLYYKTNVPAPKMKLYVYPLLCMVFDYCENQSIARLLKSAGHYDDTLLNMASIFSMLKWFFAITSIVLILLGIIRWLLHRFRKPSVN